MKVFEHRTVWNVFWNIERVDCLVKDRKEKRFTIVNKTNEAQAIYIGVFMLAESTRERALWDADIKANVMLARKKKQQKKQTRQQQQQQVYIDKQTHEWGSICHIVHTVNHIVVLI